MRCRYCDSTNLEASKVIAWGPKMGNCYHYKVKCLDCGKKYAIARTKDVFEVVKDLPWQYTKSARRQLGVGQQQLL